MADIERPEQDEVEGHSFIEQAPDIEAPDIERGDDGPDVEGHSLMVEAPDIEAPDIE